MKIGIVFAMEEEAGILNKVFAEKPEVLEHKIFKVLKYQLSTLTIISILGGIGKVCAANATVVLIEKFNVDLVLNIGVSGGINTRLGDIIISSKALYHDVDVTGFGYPKGMLPKQPLIFESKETTVNISKLSEGLSKDIRVFRGLVATGDQFINNIEIVNSIKNISTDIKALEMEAAAVAQVCYAYGVDFLLIKKISDLADKAAITVYKDELTNFDEKVTHILQVLFNMLDNKNI